MIWFWLLMPSFCWKRQRIIFWKIQNVGSKWNVVLFKDINKSCSTRPNNYLNQSKYIRSILKQFGMLESKPIWIPFMINCKLSHDMGPQSDAHLEIIWAIMFQNVIGSFMYATIYIKLDIVHVVWVVNQFMVNHGQSHWIVMKWIFHYLKGIMDFGLCFKKNIRMLLWVR